MTADAVDELRDCLPAALRSKATSITRVAAGLSGAGVFRVEADGRAFVLKRSSTTDPIESWRARLAIQQQAADAGIAPTIVHVDESRRAVLSEFVEDRSFPALLTNPGTRGDAIELLARMLRTVHELPMPADAPRSDARAFLATTWDAVRGRSALPAFVGAIIERAIASEPPPPAPLPVVSHNDVNPSNLRFDGERLMLLDWDACGVQEPLYDLATIALFFRMDDESCRRLLGAYEGRAIAEIPARFTYDRRIIGALCGAMFLMLATRDATPVLTGGETLETMPTLAEFYQRMRAGELSPATADGQRMFAMAMLRESAAT